MSAANPHTPPLLLEAFGRSDVGRKRKDNQDTHLCESVNGFGLYAAIDGVGGYAGGDIAAKMAKEQIRSRLQNFTAAPLQLLEEAVVYANNSIYAARSMDPQHANMACVLTLALVDPEKRVVHYAHIGDTRLYRYRRGRLKKLTSDHSFVGLREDHGQLTEAEAMQHPRRNEILRDIGSAPHELNEKDFIEKDSQEFLPGDTLLLCSDGLTDLVPRDDMEQLLNAHPNSSRDATEALIQAANEQGGTDNITVVVVRYQSPEASYVAPISNTDHRDDTRNLTPRAPLPAHGKHRQDAPTESAFDVPEQHASASPPPPIKRSRWYLWMLGGMLLLATGLAATWYFAPGVLLGLLPEAYTNPTPEPITITPPAVTLQSLVDSSAVAAGDSLRRVILQPGTRYAAPVTLVDSLVIDGAGAEIHLPDSSNNQAIFRIPAGIHYVALRHLRLTAASKRKLRAAIVIAHGETTVVLDSVQVEPQDLVPVLVETLSGGLQLSPIHDTPRR